MVPHCTCNQSPSFLLTLNVFQIGIEAQAMAAKQSKRVLIQFLPSDGHVFINISPWFISPLKTYIYGKILLLILFTFSIFISYGYVLKLER